MQVPVDCRLETLSKLLALNSEVRFIDVNSEAKDGLFGAELAQTMTIGELSNGSRLLSLYTQMPPKKESPAEDDKTSSGTNRLFKKKDLKPEISKKEEASSEPA